MKERLREENEGKGNEDLHTIHCNIPLVYYLETVMCVIHLWDNPICQQAKLSVVASERDGAVRELRVMAEQCQKVASEFDALAQHCDTLSRENKRVCYSIVLEHNMGKHSSIQNDILGEQLIDVKE